jgi:hypothetical protein
VRDKLGLAEPEDGKDFLQMDAKPENQVPPRSKALNREQQTALEQGEIGWLAIAD